jgi:hypothetical protein
MVPPVAPPPAVGQHLLDELSVLVVQGSNAIRLAQHAARAIDAVLALARPVDVAHRVGRPVLHAPIRRSGRHQV